MKHQKIEVPGRCVRRKHHHDREQYVVHLLWSELEFDIKYFITKGAQLSGIKGQEAKPFKFTESDHEWLARQIDVAIGKVRSKVSWALKEASRVSSNEILRHPECYDLVFEFSEEDGWQGTPDNLMNHIHNYITKDCEAEWIRITSASGYNTALQFAEDALQNVFNEVNRCLITPPKFIL